MIDPKTGIDFPFFQSQVADIFGEPDENGPFAQAYLRTLDLSQYADAFGHVKDYEGNPWGHKIYCNYVMHEPLKRAFGRIVARGLAGELRTYEGSFNIRQSKGGNFLSMHSYALATDWNAGSNAFGEEPTMNPEVVKCFAESGFEWGGLWVPDNVRDGMHFQLPWIKVRSGPLAPVAWVAA